MADRRAPWLHALAALVGGLALGFGVARLSSGFSLLDMVWAVLGFLVLGWAILDLRKYRRGTPESEVDGGRTIE